VELAERIRLAVAALPVPFGGQTLSITVSIGTATLNVGPDTDRASGLRAALESLMALADAALYTANRTGRNRVESMALSPVPARV
jgi:GGDEF domain-containing protein